MTVRPLLAAAVLVLAMLEAPRARAQEPAPGPDGGPPGAAPAEEPPPEADVAPPEPAAPQPDAPPAEVAPPGPADEPHPCEPEILNPVSAYVPGAAATGERLAGFTIQGEFFASESGQMLHAVLDQLLAKGNVYDGPRERCLVATLTRLSYRLDGPIRGRARDGGLWLTFRVHPALQIRFVDVAADFQGIRDWILPPIYLDDIRVRLGLREGGTLPDNENERAQVMAVEATKLEDWLARQGFFDAKVGIEAELVDEYEAKLIVRVDAGPAYKLGKIELIGNAAIPDEEILSLLSQTYVFGWFDDRFSKDELNADLAAVRRMYQARGFPGVRVSSNFDPATSPNRATRRVDITVRINERKRLDFAFEGLRRYGQDRLEKELTFDDEGSYDDTEAQLSADAVRAFYQREGYFGAIVTWERVNLLPKIYDRIVFSVVEGPRWRVADPILFDGNKAFSDDRLAGVIVTRPWGALSSGGYLTELQLQQDVDRIVDYYVRAGYAHVRVEAQVAPRRDLLDDPGATAASAAGEQPAGSLWVRFLVDEGERDTVTVIELVGNASYNDADLDAATGLRVGGPYARERLQLDREALQTFYAERGFPYMEVDAVAVEEPEHRFRVRFTIREGRRVAVGKTLVRGNFKTRDWVIRDVLGLGEGQVLTLGALRDGQDALRSSGLFQSVRVGLIGISPEQRYGTVHPLVEIQERYDDLGSIEARGGFSSDQSRRLYVGSGYAYRNLGGIGASAALTGEYGLLTGYYAAELTGRLPWWVIRRGLRLKMDLSTQIFARNDIDERFGELLKYGASVTGSRQIKKDLFASGRYDFVSTQVDEELVRGPGASEDLEAGKLDTVTSSIGGAIVLDRRTDLKGRLTPIVPTKGYKLSGTLEWTSSYFGGNENFVKAGGSAIALVPLRQSTQGGRYILSLGARYDHGFPLRGSVLLPETERFLAGGDQTLRGLEQDRAKTEVIRNPLPGGGESYTVRPAGGNIRALGNADLQIKLCNCLFGAPLATAVFVDTGIVTNSWYGVDWAADWRYSAGFALFRIITPIVSASVEYAIPLNPQLGDDPTGRFHINFGFVVN